MVTAGGVHMNMLRNRWAFIAALLLAVPLFAPAAAGQQNTANRAAAEIFAILPDGSTGPEGLTVGADGNVYVHVWFQPERRGERSRSTICLRSRRPAAAPGQHCRLQPSLAWAGISSHDRSAAGDRFRRRQGPEGESTQWSLVSVYDRHRQLGPERTHIRSGRKRLRVGLLPGHHLEDRAGRRRQNNVGK